MTILRRWVRSLWSGSLRNRLILGVAGVHAVMMTLFIVDFVGRQGAFLDQQARHRTIGLAQALAASSTSWVLAGDSEGLAEVVHGLTSQPDALDVMVLSPEGRVLAHSDDARRGSFLAPPESEWLRTGPVTARVLGVHGLTLDAAAPITTGEGRLVGWTLVTSSLASNEAALASARRDGVFYVAFATVVGILFALALASRLTRDLRRLAWVADRVRQGEPVRSGVQRLDELGRLATGFDAMLDAISEQQRAEAALREELTVSEERLDRALAAANEALFEYRLDGQTLTFWARGNSGLGVEGERSRGGATQTLRAWMDLVHPEDLARVDAEVRRAWSEGASELTVDVRLRKADGSFGRFEARAGRVNVLADGAARVAGTLMDVTRQREQEAHQVQLETQLRQSQKMEALGHLAGGVAHDVNNMLTAVLAHADLAAGATEDPRVLQDLDAITAAGRRAADIASQVLAFSRGRVAEPKPVDLLAVAREVQRALEPTLGGTTWQLRCQDSAVGALAERSGMVQVVMNLCTNARDIQAGTGHIHVDIARAGTLGCCASCHAALHGEYAQVTVSDAGPGIALALLPTMFEPFVTSRRGRGGTGLGLSVVHGLVHGWGGHVRVETGPTGTTFQILLPPAAAPLPAPAAPPSPQVRPPPGRVLVVDDEPAVLASISRVLVRRGWDVVTETSGAAALQRVQAGGIAVVLTDHSMPSMTGVELGRHIMALGLHVPVLLMTGNPEQLPAGAGDEMTVVIKPPDFDELSRLLK